MKCSYAFHIERLPVAKFFRKRLLKSESRELKYQPKRANFILGKSNKWLLLNETKLVIIFSVPVQGGQAIPLYLESILVMLSSLSTALQQEKEFINVIWWVSNLGNLF